MLWTTTFLPPYVSVTAMHSGCQHLPQRVEESMKLISQTLDHFPLDRIALSFNGGKDSTVLLHLVMRCLKKRGVSLSSLLCFYIVEANSFPEVDAFTKWCGQQYGICLVILQDLPFKQALSSVVIQYSIQAVFIGIRSTDPTGASLKDMQRTDVDRGWPDLMRVHPLLQWTYEEIWAFLLDEDDPKPYCSLYDDGFTSLGQMHNTRKNPCLKIEAAPSPDESRAYLPAYSLKLEEQERLGRI